MDLPASFAWLEWPCVPRWLRLALLSITSGVLHVLILPLMILLPHSAEKHWELYMRERISARSAPISIIWFFPVGRFALWCFSTLGLAWLVTNLRPVEALGLGLGDATLACYLLGWSLSELSEVQSP